MRIFLTGNRGMLGRELQQRLQIDGFDVKGVDVEELDITSSAGISPILSGYRPNLVIICAAYTAVDQAESESELAFAVNVQGPRNLARPAKNTTSRLFTSQQITFSTAAEDTHIGKTIQSTLSVYTEKVSGLVNKLSELG